MKRGPDLSSAASLVFSFSDYPLKERMSAKLSAIYGRWLGGFRTSEAREGGARQGFEIEALGGARAVLASKGLHSTVAFNKYGVNIRALEETALGALEAGAAAGKILFFDELGPIAMLSEKFSSRPVALLFSGRPCVVFCRKGARVFEEAFAKMSDTVIIELSRENWAEAVAGTQVWLDRLVRDMETFK